MPLQSNLSHPKYRPDIDGLRAIAVLSVVLFHAFPNVLRGGFIGVDVFFVISGFLISTIIFENLENGTFSFQQFYSRRIRRIFPALFLVLAASFLFGWFALLADEYKQFGKHMAAGAGFVSNFVLWGEAGYFDNSAETKPLLHLWSLGVEEQFYIIWPLLLWLAWKLRFNTLTVILAFTMISFALNVLGIRRDIVASFYLPHTRFWELLCGSLLAWFSIHKTDAFGASVSDIGRRLADLLPRGGSVRRAVLPDLISVMGMLLLLYGFRNINKNSGFPGWWALLPVIGAVLVISAGPSAWLNRVILSSRVAVWFGLISFPLYLWHWPLLSFARIVESDLPSAGVRGAAVLLSIILAWLTFRFAEGAIRKGGQNGIKVISLVLSMTLVFAAGIVSFKYDGFEFRQSVSAYQNNKNELVRTPEVDRQCLDYVGIKMPLFPYCRFNDVGGKETVAVIGDSHAHVAYPGIHELASRAGKNTVLLANASCPPLPDVPIPGTPRERAACADRVKQLLGVLATRDDIKTVFVFTRGVIYFTGTEPATGNASLLGGAEVSRIAFFEGTQKMIDLIVGAGKRVIYVTENPELRHSPQACIPRPLRIWAQDCSPRIDEVRLRFADYMTGVRQLTGATLVSSLDAFCANDRCKVIDDNGALLYADDDHLSISGSRYQAQRLLRPFLE